MDWPIAVNQKAFLCSLVGSSFIRPARFAIDNPTFLAQIFKAARCLILAMPGTSFIYSSSAAFAADSSVK